MDNSEQSELDQLLELEAICQRFESDWSESNEPAIEQYLTEESKVPLRIRLRELIVTDIEQRQINKKLLPCQHYRDLFGSHLDIVEEGISTAGKLGYWLPGQKIGRYEILNLLGSGGMGRVFKAIDTRLEREVAIKTTTAEFAQNENWIDQIREETRSLSKLAHPNVVAVYDIEEFEGQVFFVMEYLEGKDLASLIASESITDKAKKMSIALDIADAIGAAHKIGVIHCDIKPSNIFLTDEGRVKVLDFGISRRDDVANEQKQVRGNSGYGTLAYMSPEQTRGSQLDHRSDIFSFGVVVFELFTGVRAFGRNTVPDTLAAVLKDDPIQDTTHEIPANLRNLISKCIQKSPDARYQSIDKLIIDFERSQKNKGFFQPLVTIALAAFLVIAAVVWGANFLKPPLGDPKITSLAVLPFSTNIDESFFSDGLTFSLIDELSGTEHLDVRPYSSVDGLTVDDLNQQTRDDRIDQLNVSAFLSGFIRDQQDSTIIHVELIDAKDNHLIWSENYRHSGVDDFLEVQEQVVSDIKKQLRFELSSSDSLSGRTSNIAAYENYIHGVVAWNRRLPESVQTATDYFNRAADLDENYDLAYVGLANCYIVQAERSIINPEQGFELARKNALLALEKNPDSIDAQIALAMIAFEFDWAFERAEKRFREALYRNGRPIDHPTGHQWFAEFLSAMGRHDEANNEIEVAIKQDPLSAIVSTIKGLILLKGNQLDSAEQHLQSVVKKHQSFCRARGYLIDAYEQNSKYEKAIEQWKILANDKSTIEQLWKSFEEQGQDGYWQSKIDLKSELSEIRSISPIFDAIPLVKLGDYDSALQILEAEINERNGAIAPNLFVHPAFDELRSHAKFVEMIAGIGFRSQK